LATNGEWTGSYSGADLDGIDIWDSVMKGEDAGRTETVFISYKDGVYASMYEGYKYIYNYPSYSGSKPKTVFSEDLDSSLNYQSCTNPSLIEDDDDSSSSSLASWFGFGATASTSTRESVDTSFLLFASIAVLVVFAMGLMITYQSTAIRDPKNAEFYSLYKSKNDETQRLI